MQNKLIPVTRHCVRIPSDAMLLYTIRFDGYDAANSIRRLPAHFLGGVGVGVQCEACTVVTQRIGEGLHVHTVLERQRGEGVPLWHNKDKSENP